MFNSAEYKVNVPYENVSEYAEGGRYPIHVGDKFTSQESRYRIINKLGIGSVATIWAAQDEVQKKIVTIKAVESRHSENNNELRILQHIQKENLQHPGQKYLPRLIDHFYCDNHFGGRNLFIVTDLHGAPIEEVVEPRWAFSAHRMRELSRQLLLAVDCLHSCGIVHGDIHPGNVLINAPKDLKVLLDNASPSPLLRKDGTAPEKGLPRNLFLTVVYQNGYEPIEIGDPSQIILIDFSSSFFVTEPPTTLMTPANMAPPEKIFGKPLGKEVDIWSLALTTFYISMGLSLIPNSGMPDCRTIIPKIRDLLGDSSAPWLLDAWISAVRNKTWKDLPEIRFKGGPRSKNFKESKESKQSEDSKEREGPEESQNTKENEDPKEGKNPEEDNDPEILDTLQQELLRCYNFIKEDHPEHELEKRDLKVLERYLRRALVADPSARATTAELQAEEWVSTKEGVSTEIGE